MRPYYEHAGIAIYHDDCRNVLPTLRGALVLTDPPYGIGADRNLRANKRHGNAAVESRDYGVGTWDAVPPDAETLRMVLAAAPSAIVWGGNYFTLPPAPGWLVWDKDNGNNGYADCELAWTNLPQAVRRLRFRWMGMLQEHAGADKETRWHPTQKPLDVMRWCLGFGSGGLVIDPFMGSGSTLRAAKDLGLPAAGIEIEERYCEIAARRLAQEVLWSHKGE